MHFRYFHDRLIRNGLSSLDLIIIFKFDGLRGFRIEYFNWLYQFECLDRAVLVWKTIIWIIFIKFQSEIADFLLIFNFKKITAIFISKQILLIFILLIFQWALQVVKFFRRDLYFIQFDKWRQQLVCLEKVQQGAHRQMVLYWLKLAFIRI